MCRTYSCRVYPSSGAIPVDNSGRPSVLYDIAQMARKSLLAANGEGTVGAGDAASKELSEDGDADEKAMDTDE